MSTSETSTSQQKYYDPGEVEAYIAEVTNTIKTLQGRLQEMTKRAEAAERSTGDRQPETASLGRALLLAGEVADKTIADADLRAAEIIRAAEDSAAAIIDAANREAERVVDGAGGAAADAFQQGEARLLAAVSVFMEGSEVLRAELTKIEEDATAWRASAGSAAAAAATGPAIIPPPAAPSPSPSASPFALSSDDVRSPRRTDAPGQPGGIHNQAARNGAPSGNGAADPPRSPVAEPPPYAAPMTPRYPGAPAPHSTMVAPLPDPGPPDAATPYYNYPPPPGSGATGDRRSGGAL